MSSAIRFTPTVDDQYLSLTTDCIDYNGDFTVRGKVRIAVDTGAIAYLWRVSNQDAAGGGAERWDALYLDATRHLVYRRQGETSNTTQAGPAVLSVGGPFRDVRIDATPSEVLVYLDGVLEITCTQAVGARAASVAMWLASRYIATDVFNGSLAQWRARQDRLTAPEDAAEAASETAVKAGAWADWQTPAGATRVNDFPTPPNTRPWTPHGTLTDEDGPEYEIVEEEEVWLPYLATVPSGRTGRIDPLTKRTDVGQMTFRVQDHALATGPVNQGTRWFTSFFGDAFGRSRWLGLKAICDESLDGGETWTPYWTGRIQGVRAVGKLQFDILVNDMSEDLKALVGVGLPHPDVQGYAGTFSLLPLGPQAPYGLLLPPTPLGAFDRTPLFGLGRLVTIFNENRDIPTNVVTEELLAGSTPGIRNLGGDLTNYHFVPNDDGPLRVLIRHLTGAHADEVGVYRVGFLITGQRPNGTAFVTDFEIHALGDPDAPGALALPAGVNLEVLSMWQDAGISETQPLLINDQHPVQDIKDVALGYYGWRYKPGETLPPGKNYGDPKRSVTPETASFAALLADPSFPTARLWLEAIEPGGDVIENLCQGYQLGIIFNGAGELVVVDLRIPTATPTLELTDADVVAAADFDWSLDRDKSVQRVNATYYYDYQVPIDDLLSRGETLPSIRKAIVQPLRSVLEVLEVGPSDLGDTALDIDGRGYRYMDGEVVTFNGASRARVEYEKAQLAASARCLTYPFGSGGVTCQLTFRRTANALQVQPGTLLLLTVSWLPDPWTNKRGGTRVVRCTDLTREGATITARFLDYGSGSTAGVPSIGTPAQMPGNTSHGAHAVYTSNAQGDTIEVQVAVTNGGSAPAADDPAWHLVSVIGPPDTPPWTYDLYAFALPSGSRIWFRARSRPGATNRLQQASDWVVSAYVDLDGLTPPSGLSTSAIGSTVFTLSFTPGEPDARTEVLLAQPNGQPYAVVTTLPPGATSYIVTGMDAGTTVGLEIRHTDGAAGYSSTVGTTVVMLAAGNDTALPALDGFALTLYTP